MKNKFSIILILSITFILFSSCGSSKSVGCDAYSKVQQIENSDLATK